MKKIITFILKNDNYGSITFWPPDPQSQLFVIENKNWLDKILYNLNEKYKYSCLTDQLLHKIKIELLQILRNESNIGYFYVDFEVVLDKNYNI